MLLLAELEANGEDPRLRKGANYMLDATAEELRGGLSNNEQGLSCFWGNLLRYTLHCGFEGDPRVDSIVSYIVLDSLIHEWRCRQNDDLSCAWSAACALWGLASLPAQKRSAEILKTIHEGLNFLLRSYNLIDADYPTSGRILPLWFRLNFPLFYQVDILFVLRVLTELQALGLQGAQPALEWLLARRKKNGHWRGASPYRRLTWKGIAEREDTDRWVSMHDALIFQRLS